MIKWILTMIVTCVVLHLSSGRALGQWVTVSGFGLGTVNGFIVLPNGDGSNRILAGTSTGAVCSNDMGQTWTVSNIRNFVRMFAANGNHVFAATEDSGIFVSTDEGESWMVSDSGMTGAGSIYYILPIPNGRGDTSIIACTWGGFFLTKDDGKFWTHVGPSVTGASFAAAARAKTGGINIIGGTRQGLFLSTDLGENWSALSITHPGWFWNISSLDSFVVAASTDDTSSSVHVSTDGGVNWMTLALIPGVQSLGLWMPYILPDSSGGLTIAISSTVGLIQSADTGRTWASYSGPLENVLGATAYERVDSTMYVARADSGIMISNDNGKTWSNLTPSPIKPVVALASVDDIAGGNSIWAGTDIGVYKSTNLGKSWVRVPTGQRYMYVRSISSAPNGSGGADIVIGEGTPSPFAGTAPLRMSTDDGTTWSVIDTGLTDNIGEEILASSYIKDKLFIFAKTWNHGWYLTTNCGRSWAPTGAWFLPDTSVTGFAVGYGKNNETDFYMSTSTDGVFRSTNDGISWEAVNDGLPGKQAYSIVSAPSRSGGSVIMISTSPAGVGGLYVFNGTKWVRSNSFDYVVVPICVAVYSSNVFISQGNNGVFRSTDGGMNWSSVNEGMSQLDRIYSLVIDSDFVFAGAASGIWRRPISEITSVKVGDEALPATYSLLQNYPNPFNPSSIIRYQLPTSEVVTLKVYDVLGREIATLVNGKQSAGVHEVEFDGSRFASGVYFYRIKAGSYSATAKMLMVK